MKAVPRITLPDESPSASTADPRQLCSIAADRVHQSGNLTNSQRSLLDQSSQGQPAPQSCAVRPPQASPIAHLAMSHCRKRLPRSCTAASLSGRYCCQTMSCGFSIRLKSTAGKCCCERVVSSRLSQPSLPAGQADSSPRTHYTAGGHVMQSASVQVLPSGRAVHHQSGQLEQLHKSSPSTGAQQDQAQPGELLPAATTLLQLQRCLPDSSPCTCGASPKRSRQPSKATIGTRGAAMAAWADIMAAFCAWAIMKGAPVPDCQDPVPNTPAAVSRVRRRGDTTISCNKTWIGVCSTGSCSGQGWSAKQQQEESATGLLGARRCEQSRHREDNTLWCRGCCQLKLSLMPRWSRYSTCKCCCRLPATRGLCKAKPAQCAAQMYSLCRVHGCLTDADLQC